MTQAVTHQPRVAWDGARAFVQAAGSPRSEQFAARVLMGGLSGAAVGLSVGALVPGLALGVVGAVAGTYGGAAARARMAAAFGRDPPAAVIEDLVAVGGAAAIVWGLL